MALSVAEHPDVEAAIVAVARRHGLEPVRPVVLKEAHALVLRLDPWPVVGRSPVRVPAARRSPEWRERERAVVEWLLARGIPVAPPADALPPGPHAPGISTTSTSRRARATRLRRRARCCAARTSAAPRRSRAPGCSPCTATRRSRTASGCPAARSGATSRTRAWRRSSGRPPAWWRRGPPRLDPWFAWLRENV